MKFTGRLINASHFNRWALATLKHIVNEATYKYDQHLLTVDDSNTLQERLLGATMDLAPAISFLNHQDHLHDFRRNNRIQRPMVQNDEEKNLKTIEENEEQVKIEPEEDSQSLSELWKNSWEIQIRRRHEVIQSYLAFDPFSHEAWNRYQSSQIGYLNKKQFMQLHRDKSDEVMSRMWKTAIYLLESSRIDHIRLWKGVFESEEGQRFIRTNDPDALGIPFTIDLHGDLYKILLKVPLFIARDDEDLQSLELLARTIAFGCGTSIYHTHNNLVIPMRENLHQQMYGEFIVHPIDKISNGDNYSHEDNRYTERSREEDRKNEDEIVTVDVIDETTDHLYP